MVRSIAIIGLALLIGLGGAVALSQDAEPDYKALIEKLGDEDYATREKAAGEILAQGEKAVPHLEKAMKEHADAHVRMEAERLLAKILAEKGLEGERALRPQGGQGSLEEQLRDAEKRFKETIRELEKSGLLDEESLERWRKFLEQGRGMMGGLGSGVMSGMVQSNGERIRYEQSMDGHLKVELTDQNGETRTYEAESVEEFEKKWPEVYAKVRPHLGSVRFFFNGRPFGDLRGDRPLGPRLLRPEPTTPRSRAVPGGFRLGVWVGEVDEVLRYHLKLEQGEGILVEAVVQGSLADRMGIKRLDVIRKVNGRRVGDAEGIRTAFAEVPEGGKVEVELIRRGEPLKLMAPR